MRLTAFAVLLGGCAHVASPPATDPATSGAYGGRTFLSFTPAHGYQITYIGEQGTSWLWYPGNAISLPAEVNILATSVCFTYGGETWNPVTAQKGGKLACMPRTFFDYANVAEMDGDVFGLASGAVPYRRSKCDPTQEFGTPPVDQDLLKLGCG